MSRTGEPREPAYTDAEKAFLRENYGKMPVADIAAATGRSYSSIVCKAGRLGMRTGVKVAWTESEDAYLRANYLTVCSKELAEHLSRPHSSVRQRVRMLGLANEEVEAEKVRRGGIKHDYFARVDSPLKAYILGWLAADGYITRNEVRLGLHTKDASVVRLVRDELAPLHKLYRRMTGHDKRSDQTLLRITSAPMKDDLARWGVVPAKSLIIRYPTGLAPELDNSFILGYFDGNGSLMTRTPNANGRLYYRWQIVSGSKPLLQEIQERIFVNTGVFTCGPYLQRRDSQAHVIVTNCSNVTPVDAWLHADLPGLARKSLQAREAA